MIIVGESVFFGVKTPKFPANLQFMLHTCNVSDASGENVWPIIKDGCEDDLTRTTQYEQIVVGDDTLGGVSYTSFAFNVENVLQEHEETLSCKVIKYKLMIIND